MGLAPGTCLGAYEIQSLIGGGGMGEVYRARDSRLSRDVAVKVLPSDVAADHDCLARFEREAQVLASLNHLNIAQIHGVDDSSGTPALVMEPWTACASCAGASVAIWSPDSRRLVVGKDGGLVVITPDGSSPDRVLLREERRTLWPAQWLPDGRIVFLSSPDSKRFEIKVIESDGRTTNTVVPLGIGTEPDVSRDGRWIAYTTSEMGQDVVVAQAFPRPGSRTQVSAGSGSNAAWSADGRWIYYLGRVAGGGSATPIMAGDIAPSSSLVVGKPRELFRRPESQRCGIGRCYDVQSDGPKFLFHDCTATNTASVTRIDLVLNWTSTLPKGR